MCNSVPGRLSHHGSARFDSALMEKMLRAGVLLLLAALVFCLPALGHTASVYVPVDHWAYPAAERLAVLTGAQSEVLGMRPWTRQQFARFLERAREYDHNPEASALQKELEREFAAELNSEPEKEVRESLYARTTQIAGAPLRDSYHIGQTLVNDFGRPYGEGFNAIAGASGYAQYRAGMIYMRGEYQHAASLAAPSAAAVAAMAAEDSVTSDKVLTQGGPEQNIPRLLDTYVGVSWGKHWTGILGKQSLWWGPALGGAFHATNNADPYWMARMTNDVPYRIPLLGNARLDMFYGKLQQHVAESQVWIHGEKVTFQPSKSLEIGFTRTVVFLGVDYPLSFRRLWDSYFSVGDNNSTYLPKNNPGSRQGGIDFSWKLPRIPVTLYTDGYCDDDPSPLASPHRSAFHPGLYFARLPGALSHMDFRMEGSYTVGLDSSLPDFYNYWKEDYRDGYTNKGLIIGDVTGRAGVQWQVWTTYWLNPRSTVQVSFRDRYVPRTFFGGGTQSDLKTVSNLHLRQRYDLELGVQSERYIFYQLTGTRSPRYNVSGWAGLRYTPKPRSR